MRPPGADHLGNELLGDLVAQDDETAVGLLEQLEQAVHDLGQQGLHVERLAEVAADLQQGIEFFLRLRFQEQVAALAADGGLGHRGHVVIGVHFLSGGRQFLG